MRSRWPEPLGLFDSFIATFTTKPCVAGSFYFNFHSNLYFNSILVSFILI